MQCDATIRGEHIVVGFLEHKFKVIKGQPFAKQFMADAVDMNKSLQFLIKVMKKVRSIVEKISVSYKKKN